MVFPGSETKKGRPCSLASLSLLETKMTEVVRQHGRLHGPLWVDLADVLGGKWARVRLRIIQFSLVCDEVCVSSG